MQIPTLLLSLALPVAHLLLHGLRYREEAELRDALLAASSRPVAFAISPSSGELVLSLEPFSLAVGLALGALVALALVGLCGCRRFAEDSELASLSHLVLDGSDEFGICLRVRALNAPSAGWRFLGARLKVAAEVRTAAGATLAAEEAFVNQFLFLPVQNASRFQVGEITLCLKLVYARRSRRKKIGQAIVALEDLIEDHGKEWKERLLVCDDQENAVLMSGRPYWPCELSVSLSPKFLPRTWPVANQAGHPEKPNYPRHVFMMTRGTRGDVQPFVALARGMAEQEGWLVTICTESRWKKFVKDNADVERGRILFRATGGDTELRTAGALERWAMKQKTEVMQMMMLAMSEKEFLPSAPVIIYQIEELEKATQRVDLLVFAFTLASVAALAGEHLQRPIAGFFLQPSCIPSEDEDWRAVQSIKSHKLTILDELEDSICDHRTLSAAKAFMENNPFAAWNLNDLRGWFWLPPTNTWADFRASRVPLVIPMRADAFKRPFDWWEEIAATDFIFLRRGGSSSARPLGEPLESFVAQARAQRGRLVLMTVSSMPIDKEIVLTCAARMVNADPQLRLIYVGKHDGKPFPKHLGGHCIEVEKADFGVLFPRMDAFIVHGGLGTTVEALRTLKPVCVTGPLLLDQRFWGDVCAKKGVGPEPVHIDQFADHCADFVKGALSPNDPYGWQAKARTHFWGDAGDDGVAANVTRFREILAGMPAPLRTPVGRLEFWRLWLASHVRWHLLLLRLLGWTALLLLALLLLLWVTAKPCLSVFRAGSAFGALHALGVPPDLLGAGADDSSEQCPLW